jgi:hypothetical protein
MRHHVKLVQNRLVVPPEDLNQHQQIKAIQDEQVLAVVIERYQIQLIVQIYVLIDQIIFVHPMMNMKIFLIMIQIVNLNNNQRRKMSVMQNMIHSDEQRMVQTSDNEPDNHSQRNLRIKNRDMNNDLFTVREDKTLESFEDARYKKTIDRQLSYLYLIRFFFLCFSIMHKLRTD